MKKKIAIFGSTGTIGKNALRVISQHLEQYQISALVAGEDFETLASQANIFQPQFVAISNSKHYKPLKSELFQFKKIEILAGKEAINELAKIKFDFFLSAIVGIVALIPTFNAIRAGSHIGMANKECLVAAGNLMIKEAKKNNVKILPIDSEHNAIFQILEKRNLSKIEKIILTASGGPFLNFSPEEMKNVSKKQAISHPNWKMGEKISVDCATMMNKALEVIEAYHLFPLKTEQIEVIIHPQSIIHGMVNYKDGSTLAMLSQPDMQVPIASALAYPKRITINHSKLDLTEIKKLDFLKPDEIKFPALKLVRQVLKAGGNASCLFNAANEIAVARFLKEEINFNEIVKIVTRVLEKIPNQSLEKLEDVIQFNNQAKTLANIL